MTCVQYRTMICRLQAFAPRGQEQSDRTRKENANQDISSANCQMLSTSHELYVILILSR